MTKKEIIENFIQSWKPVFDEYPNLEKLPVYAWGRYYKYECAGEKFEKFPDENGLSSFESMINDSTINWELLKEIDKTHNLQGGKIWIGEWGDFSPDIRDMANHWDFDSRGGMCIVIVKNDNTLEIEVIECDSPE